jgi:enoyl-CoA hydratase
MTTLSLTALTCETTNSHIAHVQINRPEKANAMSAAVWQELRAVFNWIDATPNIRVAVLSGAGAHFTSGIDLSLLASIAQETADPCPAHMREKLRYMVLDMQDTLTAVERCRKPVIAAIHGACIGGGIDLICCADIRYGTVDAKFSIKEVDIGMTADVGTLQRLPKLIHPGIVRELALTARTFDGLEAAQIGLLNEALPSHETLIAKALSVAATIAAKSPLAVRGTKEMLAYARDHSVADSLNYIATWNAAMLMSDDLTEAMMAAKQKRAAVYRD